MWGGLVEDSWCWWWVEGVRGRGRVRVEVRLACNTDVNRSHEFREEGSTLSTTLVARLQDEKPVAHGER